MFAGIARRWNNFWFIRIDARALALFRILTGLLTLAMFLVMTPNWIRFFHADGMISLHSPDLNNQRVNSEWGLFFWTENIVPIECFWYLGVILSLMFTIGWHARLATIGLLILIDAMLRRNPYVANGEELILRLSFLYGAFANLSATWSLDRYLANRKGLPALDRVFGWPIRMFQVNIALIYAISLPYKFAQDPDWVTGDALHWTVASDMWGPHYWPFLTLAFGGWIRKIMTFGTVIVEAAFPVAVWFEPTRRLALFGIASLHLGIGAMIPNVTFFTLSMVCTFAVFLTARDFDELRELYVWFTQGRKGTESLPHRIPNAAKPS